MKKLFYRLSSRQSFAKLFSLLIIAGLGLSFVPRASAIPPLSSGGGWGGGWHHHFIDILCDFPLGGGDWTPDPNARTVTQVVNSMTCNFTDLDFDGNGKIDTAPVPAGSGLFSLTLTYTIPNNASGQLSGISCQNDVRTYTAYCEQALFTNNGVTGSFTLLSAPLSSSTVLSKLGCVALSGCTWPLGSLPSKSQGQTIVLDTSQFGCQRAFPATTVQFPSALPVDLATNQLLLYTEEFTNGNGQCIAGTVAPIKHAARACFGEANASVVTDCNQTGSGNQTSYHVAFQQNTSYLLPVSGFKSTQKNVSDATSCQNSGTVKFSISSEPLFDVQSIAGLVPFIPDLAPKLTVVGHTVGGPIPLTKVSTFTDHVDLFYSQCAIGNQISSIPGFHTGDMVTMEINGQTIPAPDGGSVPFNGTTSVGTN